MRRGVCAHLWTAPTDRIPSKLATCLQTGCADAAGAKLRVQLLLAKAQLECVSIAELMLTVGKVALARIECDCALCNSQQPSTVKLEALTYPIHRPCDPFIRPFAQAAATPHTQPSTDHPSLD